MLIYSISLTSFSYPILFQRTNLIYIYILRLRVDLFIFNFHEYIFRNKLEWLIDIKGSSSWRLKIMKFVLIGEFGGLLIWNLSPDLSTKVLTGKISLVPNQKYLNILVGVVFDLKDPLV